MPSRPAIRKPLFFAALSALAILFSSAAFAADDWKVVEKKKDWSGEFFRAFDRTHRADLGFYAAGTNIEDGIAEDAGYFAGKASYGLTPWAAIGVEGGLTSETGTDLGDDLQIALFMVEVIVRLEEFRAEWNEYRLVPYVTGGIGGMWSWLDRGARGDYDHGSFGWKFGVGADYFLNRNWALNAEAAYYMSYDNMPVHPEEDPESNLSFWTFGGALKYVY